MQSIENKVLSRIYGKRRGWCFTPNSFGDLGSLSAIRQSLVRLEKRNVIRRIARGLYDYPKKHKDIGLLPPDIYTAALALAKQTASVIQPSGAMAANLLGLSEQVPAKVVFLTDGKSRKRKIGNTEIFFKSVATRFLALAGTNAGLLIQALKFIGKENINDETFLKAWEKLDLDNKKLLLGKKFTAPIWLQIYIEKFGKEGRLG